MTVGSHRLDPQGIIGIDVGGTFTDCVAFDAATGTVRIAKVPTTPADQSVGVVDGIDQTELTLSGVSQIVHGTTVATNAVIERKGAETALVTTAGFRDVLELGRRDRPHVYGLTGTFTPLVPRHRRFELAERVGPDGTVLEEVTRAEIERVVAEISASGATAVAISFLHSYANDDHERQVHEALAAALPGTYVVRSSAIYPELGEFERTSTVVIAAYIGPLVSAYFDGLGTALASKGYDRDFMVVQSNGGASSYRIASQYPTSTVLSGPAAGIVAASAVGEAVGINRLVSFDMGGTSADIAVVVDGKIRSTVDNALGFRMPLQVPMLEIQTIGAGGGSIAWIDDAEILRVGPRSAGSVPGPACYGRGGTEPTVTDAHVVLGHMPVSILDDKDTGGAGRAEAAEAVRRVVAEPLGISTEAAAQAILEVVNENMAGAIRLATVEKGLDVRQFGLVAFGGAGPMHACGLMRKLGLERAAIPIFPGLTSALGALMTDARHDFVQPVRRRIEDLSLSELHDILKRHRSAGEDLLQQQGITADSHQEVEFAMLYEGQRHTVAVEIDPEQLHGTDDLQERFEEAYRAIYGSVLSRPIQVESVRSEIVAPLGTLDLERCAAGFVDSGTFEAQAGTSWFGGEQLETPILPRVGGDAGPRTVVGPAIIVQRDTTTIVEPGFVATDGKAGTLEIRWA